MNVETLADNLILVHAGFGGISLLSGLIALISKKGSRIHKQAGKAFYYALLASALIAVVVALMPGHLSYFLLVVGIFSLYLTISGRAFLKLKKVKSKTDIQKLLWITSFTMLAVGGAMVLFALSKILAGDTRVIVLLIFGTIGASLAYRDIKLFKKAGSIKLPWLPMHIGNMTGAYIASVTAFMVVNELLPSIISWLLPSVIGTIYITYWIRKVSPKKTIS